MSDEVAFLRAIRANPADTTARLVYADWLDERGEHEKAHYLRIAAAGGPGRGESKSESARRHERERRLRSWLDLLGGQVHLWDPVTLFALGRLQGVLAGYASVNTPQSDISYDYNARLVPRTGSVAEMAAAWLGPEGSVAAELLADWEADLRTVLTEWLFLELRYLSSNSTHHTRLAFRTEHGRRWHVDELIARIREVITPTAGWRIQVTPTGFYAIDWADLVLESDDRVLWLHFSFSD